MYRIVPKTAAEHDVISRRARRVLPYLQRAGVCAGIRRQMTRRDRQAARRELGRGRSPRAYAFV